MLQGWVILLVALLYVATLFLIASYGDRRADAGRSIINSPYVYTLSIAVYCTTWTFYGSVGRAATSGIGFLPIYIGPTLMVLIWWFVLRKIVRICRIQRITSIADFVASRYGKDPVVGGLVTVIAVVGILPYISLQLKAVSTSFTVLISYPDIAIPSDLDHASILSDTALYVALLLAAFAILFGTRHIDATEHHEGMVAAVAFESIVKLVAFLAAGAFVTYGVYDGFSDVFSRAAEIPELSKLFTFGSDVIQYDQWLTLTFLSMMAIMFLPRQFQVAVIENKSEDHIRTAMWLFPLYMLAINIFVLPIALGGLMRFPDGAVDADTFLLALPMVEKQELLALLVFIGGLSAATAMVIMATVALSTMISNDLVIPVLLRFKRLGLSGRAELGPLLLAIRRGSIVIILLLGYTYFRLIGESYALVAIGLVSFAAAAQFAPAILGGVYWQGGTRRGALAGLSAGFIVWGYTLVFPSFIHSGWIDSSYLTFGVFGVELLRPYELFGLANLDPITHSLFWSLLANIGLYVGVSMLDRPEALERSQAALFVDVFKYSEEDGGSRFWRGTANVEALQTLVARFVGEERATRQFHAYARSRGLDLTTMETASPGLVTFAEKLMAGSIGAASARVMVSSVVTEEPLGIGEVMEILDETSQVIEYSHQLEQKSRELEKATADLRKANTQLKELDRLKDDFITTVTHELRTPLTSIRSFSEILHDNPDLDDEQRHNFLSIVVKETERLSRLINQVLDLARLEAGETDWQFETLDLADVLRDSLDSTSQLFKDHNIALTVDCPDRVPPISADRDRIMQVVINLLSNAVKFSPKENGRVDVRLTDTGYGVRIDVGDNGPGIEPEDQTAVFEKFRQVGNTLTGKPVGSGLGLAICRQTIDQLGGRIWVDSTPGAGATFSFVLPHADAKAAE